MSTAVAQSTAYEQLEKRWREATLLRSTHALLDWDQEVNMPPQGVTQRAEQSALIARLTHERVTAPEIGSLLQACEEDAALMADPFSDAAVNVREIRRTYDRKTKLPAQMIEEESRIASLGQHVWAKARKAKDFNAFAPTLEKIVELLQRKAECYGWAEGGEPWDALADDYEPGCTAAFVESVFTPLRDRLQNLLGELMSTGKGPTNRLNEINVPIEKQRQFVQHVVKSIGFDFQRGRMDESTHPFCSGTCCDDVRLTTRYRPNEINDALGSSMHEAGHGIYEQGLLAIHTGMPRGDSVSLGIHESQSRMWENQVGRSQAFWRWLHPQLGDLLGPEIGALSLDEVYGGANLVRPSFIRVEADEATYNMHVMVRFELERAMLKGDLSIADLPAAWNEKYKNYLGIDVPDDGVGCLQDVHWSGASMGYFPTYTLGNLYCAQFFEQVLEEIPDLHDQFAAGEFGSLKNWLNTNIHEPGQTYQASDLCERVTGKPLSADPLMRHLEGKLKPMYGLA